MQKLRVLFWVLGIAVAVFFGAWSIVVWRSGLGWNPSGESWDFETTGQLGDSFGVVGALMGSTAALFAMLTYIESRSQNEGLTRREIKRVNEEHFFRLLDARLSIVAGTSVGPAGKLKVGQEAFESMAKSFTGRWAGFSPSEAGVHYASKYDSRKGELGHYFRTTYHILKFADERFGTEAYQYARLLRAQWSNNEQILIALNCAFGEGVSKFKPLLEKYAMLHNLHPKDIERMNLRASFAPSAFESTEVFRTES